MCFEVSGFNLQLFGITLAGDALCRDALRGASSWGRVSGLFSCGCADLVEWARTKCSKFVCLFFFFNAQTAEGWRWVC